MNKAAAHTHAWMTAEMIFGISLLLSLVLNFLVPLSLSRWVPRAASIGAGILLLTIGLVMVVLTRSQFRQAGQPTDPGFPTTQLITTGPFSWSRNPLYLAGAVVYLGLAVLLNSLWMLIFFLPFTGAIHFVLIVPEEKYLQATFGEGYLRYAGSVRRWIGRRR